MEQTIKNTNASAKWIHFGAGNIFRAFVANCCQTLLNKGLLDSGILAIETFDDEVISKAFAPFNNLTALVKAKANGEFDKSIVASVAEAIVYRNNKQRAVEAFVNPELQMVSFTVTEKGYSLRASNGEFFPFVVADIENGPKSDCTHLVSIVCSLLYERFEAGDLPKLKEICALSRQYGAYVFLDDAHGVGVLSKNGYGTRSHFNLSDEVDVITGTLSKAIGTIGGYVADSSQLIKYLRHLSRPSIFSASLPPSVVVSASKAIDVFTEETQIIEKLWKNTKYARKTLVENGFDLGRSESPIIPVMVRDDMKAKIIARKLLENGVYIIPATYPAVKLKDSRLRMNIFATHTESDIDYFCEQLNCINKEIEFK
ncbi:MAG: aminotransferase class I/II-fold pyridoxal phosphate-dependent enzyme [Mangrovibacterium sp.]